MNKLRKTSLSAKLLGLIIGSALLCNSFSVLYLLSVFGVTFFLKNSYIFSKPRFFLYKSDFLFKLFQCSFCLSFHVSWIIYLLCFPLSLLILLFSTAGAGFVFIVYNFFELNE